MSFSPSTVMVVTSGIVGERILTRISQSYGQRTSLLCQQKLVLESCDLVNKNTNEAKNKCWSVNISTSRTVQSLSGRFQREPLPLDLRYVSQWFSKCGSGKSNISIAQELSGMKFLGSIPDLSPKVRLCSKPWRTGKNPATYKTV